jgi:hypothetical protein
VFCPQEGIMCKINVLLKHLSLDKNHHFKDWHFKDFKDFKDLKNWHFKDYMPSKGHSHFIA